MLNGTCVAENSINAKGAIAIAEALPLGTLDLSSEGLEQIEKHVIFQRMGMFIITTRLDYK